MREIAAQVGSGSNASAGEGRSRRSDVSRQQILDVAAKLFRARGYSETSLRDIAKLVGMKAGSLYYHFASKEELADEVLRIGVRRVHAAVVTAADAQGAHANVRSKLAGAMAAHLETLLDESDESDYTSAHIRCFPNVPETLRVQLGNDRRAYEQVWRTLLDEAAKSNSLKSGMDPGAARLAILGALNWSLEWYDPAQGLPSELTRTLLAGFLR